MQNPTSDHPPQAPAPLLRYKTWADDTGYHAEYTEPLSPSALHYGCKQTITAPTELELRQEAVRNRVRVEAWESGRAAAVAEQLSEINEQAVREPNSPPTE